MHLLPSFGAGRAVIVLSAVSILLSARSVFADHTGTDSSDGQGQEQNQGTNQGVGQGAGQGTGQGQNQGVGQGENQGVDQQPTPLPPSPTPGSGGTGSSTPGSSAVVSTNVPAQQVGPGTLDTSASGSTGVRGSIRLLSTNRQLVRVTVSPADAVRRVYARVGTQIVEFRSRGNRIYAGMVAATRMPFTITADFGTTTASVKLAPSRVAGALAERTPLLSALTRLYRRVFGRLPTLTERRYWVARILRREKTSLGSLLGALEWHERFGRR